MKLKLAPKHTRKGAVWPENGGNMHTPHRGQTPLRHPFGLTSPQCRDQFHCAEGYITDRIIAQGFGHCVAQDGDIIDIIKMV